MIFNLANLYEWSHCYLVVYSVHDHQLPNAHPLDVIYERTKYTTGSLKLVNILIRLED